MDHAHRRACYKTRVRWTLLFSFLFLACSHPGAKQAPPHDDEISFGHGHIGIFTSSGARYALDVEIASDDPQRERGLMFRRSLGENAGMIFLFDQDQVQSFWMRNTLIPLDMIFIGADGIIIGIVADAAPETDSIRTVDKPSRYVLEVNGGWAALKGVRPGDRVDVSGAIAAGH
jgi:uncharacterized membrane protein (UPF0127 family)